MPAGDSQSSEVNVVVMQQTFHPKTNRISQMVAQADRSASGATLFESVNPSADFHKSLRNSAFKPKRRLQNRYEKVYPNLREIIGYVVAEEEANAKRLSPEFPHLVLADLVEMHMERLGLSILSGAAENELGDNFFTATESSWTSTLGQAA